MRRRPVLAVAVVVVLVAAAAIALLPLQKVRAQDPLPAPRVPDAVAYQHLFRRVLALKKRADEAAQQGKDRSSLRSLLAREAGLNDAEAQWLEAAATQCATDLAPVDSQAKAVVAETRARYPYGILNPSFPPPAPDPRLHDLQQQRNDAVMTCRERLRNTLGEESFLKLDNWLQAKLARSFVGTRPRPNRQVSRRGNN